MAKDAWGVIGSAYVHPPLWFMTARAHPFISLGVQQTIQEMERLQAKGELAEEELRALEEDVTGKVRPPLYSLYALSLSI